MQTHINDHQLWDAVYQLRASHRVALYCGHTSAFSIGGNDLLKACNPLLSVISLREAEVVKVPNGFKRFSVVAYGENSALSTAGGSFYSDSIVLGSRSCAAAGPGGVAAAYGYRSSVVTSGHYSKNVDRSQVPHHWELHGSEGDLLGVPSLFKVVDIADPAVLATNKEGAK